MGRADFLELGGWNACCQRCGKKRKGGDLRKTWDGLWVCPEHWEPRHPQDFVKAVKENIAAPVVRKPAPVHLGSKSYSPGEGGLILLGHSPSVV